MSGGGYGQSPMGSFGNRQVYGGGGFNGYQGAPRMSGDFQGGQQRQNWGGFGGNQAYTPPIRGGLQYDPGMQPSAQPFPAQKSWGPQGFTGMEFMGGQPQMATQFQGGINPGRNMIGQAAPGFEVNQRQAPVQPMQPPQPQGQSFEQFAATLGNSGMTSGQMADLYAKQSQGNYNFGGNTGVGTQRPNGFTPPETWGPQTYGFDPRSMAGKTVTKDLGWYYGMDAIGRPINDQGDAYAKFNPAVGGGRNMPWFK